MLSNSLVSAPILLFLNTGELDEIFVLEVYTAGRYSGFRVGDLARILTLLRPQRMNTGRNAPAQNRVQFEISEIK